MKMFLMVKNINLIIFDLVLCIPGIKCKSFVTMIVEYQWVLSGTFALKFLPAVDQWKIFTKIKLN